MAKGRIDASQHLVLSDWQLCGEKRCVQDFGVFTCTTETVCNTETYKRIQYDEGNSTSKLQIQVATYVFELSAENCHR
jgi:hypothetical protein